MNGNGLFQPWHVNINRSAKRRYAWLAIGSNTYIKVVRKRPELEVVRPGVIRRHRYPINGELT